MSLFSNASHLVGRYPQVARDEDFQAWSRKNGAELWHETPVSEEGYKTVIIQSLDRLHLFTVLIKHDTSQIEQGRITDEILRKVEFDLLDEGLTAETALLAYKANTGKVPYRSTGKTPHIQALRPVVDLLQTTPSVEWELELVENSTLEKYSVKATDTVLLVSTVQQEKVEMQQKAESLIPIPLSSDWLEENDLHHLSLMRQQAEQWTAGRNTVSEKAFFISLNVQGKMVYDATITNISEFTWADGLVTSLLGWRGICDEWAVVQISLLRSLGIPAVMKFLTFKQNGTPAAHACLEFLDNGRWVHMDGLWNGFDNPSVYRQNGCTDVLVMDANSPRDDRSTEPAWGVPDPTGDGKLYAYGDFIIYPSYPGNSRAGYSY
jgi:Transglutaminase-like superfamily